MAILRFLALLRLLSVTFLLLGGACRAQDLDSWPALGQVANEEQLRQTVAQEPSPGMSAPQLTQFYRAQAVAAGLLGDRIAQERILRRWIKDVPNNLGPRRLLSDVLVATDSHELYEKLFKPVAASLHGARSIVVAPGGVLGQVPMGVLLTAP